MAENGVEDAALLETEGHKGGFVTTGAFICWIGIGCSEHMHVSAGATHAGIEFVPDMHPFGGKAFSDRVLRVAVNELVREAGSVATGLTGRGVCFELAVFIEPIGAVFLGTVAPATDADHLVVGFPFREGIVGSVEDDNATTSGDVLFKRGLQRVGPAVIGCIVVQDNGFVLAKVRVEGGEVSTFGWGGDNVDGEEAGLVEHLLEIRSCLLPRVVRAALFSIQKHDLDWGSSGEE